MNNTVSCKSPSIELPEPIWRTDSHIDGKGEPCYLVDEVYEIVEKLTAGVTSEAVGGELPKLPQHIGKATDMFGNKSKLYSAEQMRAYARVAIAATQPQQSSHKVPELAVTDEVETWIKKAVYHLNDLRDYIIEERDAHVLPRKTGRYQAELDKLDEFIAALQRLTHKETNNV